MPKNGMVATMLQRLLDRFVPVREDDASWLDRRDGVGLSAPVAAQHLTGVVENAAERTLQR